MNNGLKQLPDKKEGGDYLRFLKSFVPSISVTYWNPFSISSVASLILVAVLQTYSSSSAIGIPLM